ncbi:TVC1 protein, partial [Malurus elegans]|nr:TVC1 protein [Malurus elegans]
YRLRVFVLFSLFLDGEAQVLLKQRQVSITRRHKTTTSMDCAVEGVADFQNAYIHCYRCVLCKAPEWILYIRSGAASYNDNSYKKKYSSLKKGTNVCTFTINDINSSNEGTYYCAYWHF